MYVQLWLVPTLLHVITNVYTILFGPIGHLHVYHLLSHCSQLLISLVLFSVCAVMHVFNVEVFWLNFRGSHGYVRVAEFHTLCLMVGRKFLKCLKF
jgi:hypothetical protein